MGWENLLQFCDWPYNTREFQGIELDANDAVNEISDHEQGDIRY